jgi:predicted naringenin-chalcone synthase
MDTSDHAPEQLVIQSLFADGNIKYSVTEHDGAPAGSGLEILRIHEQIIPSTGDQMSWVTGEWGMRMTLSREVPASVVRSLRQFLDGLLVGSGVSPEEAAETAIFAIHPGGPRIIDSIQEFAELRDEQVAHSRSVLLRYGNMSSATLPHVWRDLVADDSVAPGRPIVSLAFGPGLTIFGALLRKTGL